MYFIYAYIYNMSLKCSYLVKLSSELKETEGTKKRERKMREYVNYAHYCRGTTNYTINNDVGFYS